MESGSRESQLALYRSRLASVLPALDLSQVWLVQSGQNSDVVMIGGDLVARFPRNPTGIRHMEWEAKLLRVLSPRLPLAIPDPVTVTHGEPGEAFMVYRAVPGAPLAREVLAGIDEQTIETFATQLAAFLRTLHAIPPEEVLLPADASGYWLHRWEDLYARIQAALFTSMPGPARAWTEHHFDNFLGDPRNREVLPVVVHGDFGGTNILVDPDEGRVTGVIDFGSVHLDDPAVDLAAASTLGPGFLHRFAPMYSDLAAALPRVAFYEGTFALQEALFGAENGDPGALAAGLAGVPPRSEC